MERLWGYVCGGILRLWFKENKSFNFYLEQKNAKWFKSGNFWELPFKDIDIYEFNDFFKVIDITIFINSDPTYIDEEKEKEQKKHNKVNYKIFSAEELKRIKMLKFMNVKEDFTIEELRKQYRKLVKKYHPDTGGNNEDFIKLQHYFAILNSEIEDRKEKV